MDSMISSFVTAFGDMADSALLGIASVLPVVLPVMAAIIVLGIIIKVAKKATK